VVGEDLTVTGKVVLLESRRGESAFGIKKAGELRDQVLPLEGISCALDLELVFMAPFREFLEVWLRFGAHLHWVGEGCWAQRRIANMYGIVFLSISRLMRIPSTFECG
jgi:hypothetical protein